ncbi:MAG: BMP family ABC transporter substrate-binding protein [Ktedonobacteraceae bacterium]|nr:BMP family ABC transporter substrate-binding protein [Ktedonobacteraceae bacterium]MBO0790250.1 BMP family ABC transporter substrate-binding protein [Ktedonobacteraceae bacterium]
MRRLGNLATLASLFTLFAMLVTACGGGNPSGTGGNTNQKTAKKVAIVTDTGGLNDQGFNQLAYKGYKQALSEFGFSEKVVQTQSQNDYVQNLTSAAQAADLVIAVGFLMDTPIYQVAKQFPSKSFAIVDGCAVPAGQQDCVVLPNVAPLSFKEQEAGCLVGAMAAQMEVDGKSKISRLLGKNTIGAVGGLSIPPVNRYIAGYKYCAQKVDPSVQVKVNYSQDFSATAKCKDAALTLINQFQADIIFQVAGGCGIGALDAADQKGVFGIGVDNDQGYIHSSVITSALKRVDTAVYLTIKNFQNGQYSNKPPVFNLAQDGVGYATVSKDVPADAKQKADDFAKQIKDGTLTPPENIS